MLLEFPAWMQLGDDNINWGSVEMNKDNEMGFLK